MAEELTTCKVCNQPVSNKAKKCPHCGARLKMAVWLKIVIVILAIGVFNGVTANLSKSQPSESSSQTSTATGVSSSEAQSVPAVDNRPDDQKQFEEICSQYRTEYDKASNEIQQSVARNGRKNALQQLGIKYIEDWIGTLDNLSINNDGKGIITIELQSGLKIRTWNNAFSDIGDNTLISPESTVFNSLINLKEGQKVSFSGTFITGSDTDYIKVTGMNTRDAMEMRSNGFLMKFTEIQSLR